jgi:hypothetical protein
MVEPLTVDRATVDCFLFAMTDGRSLALTAVLAVVFWCFPEGRLAGAPVVKLFGRELEDTSAAETAVAAVVRCNCCCGCSCCDDMEGPADEGQFLLSSQISLLLLSFSRFLELAGRFLLPCSALAAEGFNSLQVKLMLLPPLADLITSLADMPFSRQSQNNVSAREAVGPSDDGRLAVAPGCWGVNLLTDRRFGWRPLEAAPSPSVPLSPLVDISLV